MFPLLSKQNARKEAPVSSVATICYILCLPPLLTKVHTGALRSEHEENLPRKDVTGLDDMRVDGSVYSGVYGAGGIAAACAADIHQGRCSDLPGEVSIVSPARLHRPDVIGDV